MPVVCVGNDPSSSLVADIPEAQPPASPEHRAAKLAARTCFANDLGDPGFAGVGHQAQGWYLVELGGVFVALATWRSGWYRAESSMPWRGLYRGRHGAHRHRAAHRLCPRIELMLSDGQVLHTIVNALAIPLEAAGGSGFSGRDAADPECPELVYSLRFGPGLCHHAV